jgi:hemerythrin superfamily protein
MDAIELLEQQHRQVEGLFEALLSADEGDSERRQVIFDQLADALAGHTIIEEQLFYPVAKRIDEDLIQESLEEHLEVKRMLADLLDLAPDDDGFEAKVQEMQEAVEHHVSEEENELFPKVRRNLDADRRNELGDEMESMFEGMRQEHPRRHIPDLIAESPTP